MKKILNALFLTIFTLVTFSCSDVPAPYDINEGGGGEGPNVEGSGTKEDPYDVTSAMSIQDNSVAWVKGYIVGCVNDKSIQTDAVFAAPFENPANILIAATPDETDYKKCLAIQLPNNAVRTALNLKDNAANLGKEVNIQGKLTKYFGVAGLKECAAAIFDGKEIGTPVDPDEGEGGSGDGSKENPFDVTSAMSKQDNSEAWVKGYIVGAVDGMSIQENSNFTGPFTTNSNLLIAASATEKDYTKCLVVQLPFGDLRTALNLVDNATNLGKEVKIKGKLTKYFGVAGLKECTVAVLDGKEIGESGGGEGGETVGDGTKDKPYDVTSAMAKQDNSEAWVKGYIVGNVDGKSIQDNSNFTGPFTTSSNILIAASATEKDYTKCLAIQLPNNDLRKAVNLVDNAGNLGKEINIKGNLTKYFGVAGLKNCVTAVLDGKDVGEGGGSEGGETGDGVIFSETFGEGDAGKKKVGAYTGYDNQGKLTFTDEFGTADVRALSGNNNLWLPANKQSSLKISGINTTGYKKLTLTYEIACFTVGADIRIVKVKCGDTTMTVPEGTIAASNTFQEIKIDNVPTGISTIEFITNADENTQGFRIDNIKLSGEK